MSSSSPARSATRCFVPSSRLQQRLRSAPAAEHCTSPSSGKLRAAWTRRSMPPRLPIRSARSSCTERAHSAPATRACTSMPPCRAAASTSTWDASRVAPHGAHGAWRSALHPALPPALPPHCHPAPPRTALCIAPCIAPRIATLNYHPALPPALPTAQSPPAHRARPHLARPRRSRQGCAAPPPRRPGPGL